MREREIGIDHRETSPSGAHAKWIRVTQEDWALAWTTLVYLAQGRSLIPWVARWFLYQQIGRPRVRRRARIEAPLKECVES